MMMNEPGLRRILPDQSSGSVHTFGTARHQSVIDPILSKRVCFYKSGDPQFNGLRLVINNRTFKTFDALLDSLSKKVPLPFGVRNITTPRGVHAINTLDQLEDGKSYICSDSRKVKPINLALARKKLPPWYHARPASSRRRTVQQARFFPGRSLHKQELVRTPKRLQVFRNGDPTVKQTVVLHKKNTPTYESILEYISELMQFHVVKLYTPDGRRVDGLPGLILCSGTVVAVGREPFKPANYSAQKSTAPAWPYSNRKRRQKALNRKRKSLSFSSKSRNFSQSSERYIVHQIHNTIAESSCGIPSNTTNSVELESTRILESVAETDGGTCGGDGAEGRGSLLPTDDDIEKSFRVNQDGSMTVEMRVRLTLKEEETIHWTTTLSRSSVANQHKEPCLLESVADQEICSPELNSMDFQSPAASNDTIIKDKTKDNNDDDPPSLGNGASTESCDEEYDLKHHADVLSPKRASTPGHNKQVGNVENITSMTAGGIQDRMAGSYSYREHTEKGTMTEQYCMVRQSSTKPVPKPRRLCSVDANGRNVPTFTSAGMTELLQFESSGDEVTETVLHIYEQQTCQDNFLANVCAHSMSASAFMYGRPATSETGQLSLNNECEPEVWRPSTASGSVSIWRAESMSVMSDFNLLPPETGTIQDTNRQPTKGQVKTQQRETSKDKRASSKYSKNVRRILTPGKRQKENSAEAETHKKVKAFSSAKFIKKIYGNKSKSPKSAKALKKKPTQNGDAEKLQVSHHAVSNLPSEPKDDTGASFEISRMNVSPNVISQPRGVLTRQTSMHTEKNSENKSYDISDSMSLPAFNSSTSVTKEYVENWLEKAHLSPPSYPEQEHEQLEAVTQSRAENGRKPEKKNEPPVEDLPRTSVKLRVHSFENKLSSPSVEKTLSQQSVHNHTTATNTGGKTTEELKPVSNGPPTTDMDREVKNKPNPVKILFQKATPSNSQSMDLPPPPPPDEITQLSDPEYHMIDVSSAASSPLYRLSSLSSQGTDNPPSSVSPTSDKATSPPDSTMATTTPVQTDIPSTLQEATLTRAPSVKRAPLISNLSLERKMSLRKASLDKYTLSSDATAVTATLSIAAGNDVQLNETQQLTKAPPEGAQQPITDLMKTPSCCTSVSPTSSTSEEVMSSASISSSEATMPSSLPSKEAKMTKSSPKMLGKKHASPSPERKFQNKKLPNNSPKSLHSHHKSASPRTPHMSPSTERRQTPYKPKQQKRPSPYSQSLDMVSPPVRHKTGRKMLSRNLSSEDLPELTNKTQTTPSSPRKTQALQSVKSTSDTGKALDSDQSDENKTQLATTDQEKPMTPQTLSTAEQPNMKPVLEKICYSIKSIRQITQNKRPSCLEKSNSLPDFSSHVASTFGSSSKALLAFLAVMTLKEGLTNLNMDELNANNVSCAEALKMIDSLREIATIEDSHQLKASLSNLQQSASKQLLQSWKGFQELSDRCKSRSSTSSGQEIIAEAEQECVTEENVINEIMDDLDVPGKLKEELASFSVCTNNESDAEEEVEVSPKENTNLSSPEAVNVDVRSIIKKVTDSKESGLDSLNTEAAKHKPTSPTTEENDDQNGQDGMTKHPPAETNSNQSPGEMQLYSTLIVQGNDEDSQPENQEEDRSTQDINGLVHREKNLTQESCSFKAEEQESRQLQTESEGSMSIPDNDEESGSDEDRHRSANKVLEQKETCMQSGSSSEAGEQCSSEEEPEVAHEEVKQQSSASHSEEEEEEDEEEEDKQQDSNSYVELNMGQKGSVSSPEGELCSPSQPACLSDPEKEQQSQTCSMGLNVSVDESTGNSDVEEPSSEEEQPEAGSKELQVIVEESQSDEERERMEEQHRPPAPDAAKQSKTYKGLKPLIEEVEEEGLSLEDEAQICDKTKSILTEDDGGVLIKSECLEKDYTFNADDDSGNDHNSCEEHDEQPKIKDELISSSIEEELSYYEKESSSEEEQPLMDRYTDKSKYQEAPQSVITKCEKQVEKLKHQPEEITSQSVAERVVLLERQVAEAQKIQSTSAVRCFSQRKAPPESDLEDSPSESPTTQSALCTRSAPQSSLSFSYDSSGVITTEPEGSRVRSIREMFLAKSATDIQQRRLSSEEPRAETSISGGYQSQTSSELSSGEEDSSRKSITKGFVRRTIERLYGKKDSTPDEEVGERPPSQPKQKKKNGSSIFSPFHTAREKAMSELSYFNSTNALDTLSEATRCIAFNAQVGPGDSVPIDNGRWLIKENTVIRKSVSDPVGINKAFTNSPDGERICKDTEDNTPYSLFNTKPEVEDKTKTLSRKCTYFALPHASDSDACQDDQSSVGKNSVNGDSVMEAKDTSEDNKTWAERNGMLPSVTDFKMMDNKVHPLVELPPEGEVVVMQPGKGQAVVNRRIQDPDMLDFLYNFCGQHCPIL